mmetsp:Transcript_39610/g.125955  ORF Transcript_39610/g.125955 Transcript_39610/m.125955 type:complete len:201 (+) Transcript_39610:2882-3484(+)
MLEALDAELHTSRRVLHLQEDGERCQVRPASHLEEGPHVLDALRRHVGRAPRLGDLLLHHLLRLLHDALRLAHEELKLLLGALCRLRVHTRAGLVVLPERDGVCGHGVVELLEVIPRQVLAVVDAAVVDHKLVLGHLVLDAGVVQVRLEHDHRKREHECAVRVRKLPRVVVAVLLRKLLHHPVDLLRLARQAEHREETPQ